MCVYFLTVAAAAAAYITQVVIIYVLSVNVFVRVFFNLFVFDIFKYFF